LTISIECWSTLPALPAWPNMNQLDIQAAKPERKGGVRFTEDDGDKEVQALLGNSNTQTSDSPAHAPLVFGSMSANTPQPAERTVQRPADLQQVPSNFYLWPGHSLHIACPQCGNFIQTTLDEETECVGFNSLFSNGPLFRTILSHYCPNCQNFIGLHYTGQSCGRGMGCCHVQ